MVVVTINTLVRPPLSRGAHLLVARSVLLPPEELVVFVVVKLKLRVMIRDVQVSNILESPLKLLSCFLISTSHQSSHKINLNILTN